MTRLLRSIDYCQICGGRELRPVHRAIFDFTEYAEQDPELHSYTGTSFSLDECHSCGFGQPEGLPTLDRFFERMYDQRWSPEWLESEYTAEYKDTIFRDVLSGLERRAVPGRKLLDVGAHVGRFVSLAVEKGWDAEGVELNPRTSEYARRATGRPIHQSTAQEMIRLGHSYDAIVVTDVHEHIPDPVGLLDGLARLTVAGFPIEGTVGVEGGAIVVRPTAPILNLGEVTVPLPALPGGVSVQQAVVRPGVLRLSGATPTFHLDPADPTG